MHTNFLEELVAEWYEYKGYFVKRNEKVNPLQDGGFEGELDIVVLDPQNKRFIHIETSSDSKSWARREKSFKKKFEVGAKCIRTLFRGLRLPKKIEKQAILASGSDDNHPYVGGGKVVLVKKFLLDVLEGLKGTHNTVPEKYPLIRALQMIASDDFYRKDVVNSFHPN
jgi:hypothetical protein